MSGMWWYHVNVSRIIYAAQEALGLMWPRCEFRYIYKNYVLIKNLCVVFC